VERPPYAQTKIVTEEQIHEAAQNGTKM